MAPPKMGGHCQYPVSPLGILRHGATTDCYLSQLVNLHYLTDTPRGVYSEGMNINKEKIARRLKILEGQVRGLQDMVEKGAYCIDVITQSSAVKQGLSNVEDMLMEHHLSHCVVDQIKSGAPNKAIGEVLKVYKLKRK